MKRTLIGLLALLVALSADAVIKSPAVSAVSALLTTAQTFTAAQTFAVPIAFSGAAPVVSACGTSPSIDAHATNSSGTVTVGTVTATSCTITFATSGFVTWNHCNVTAQSTLAAFAYSYTKTVITVTGTTLVSAILDYRCDGS
jgi:hypothetical protein